MKRAELLVQVIIEIADDVDGDNLEININPDQCKVTCVGDTKPTGRIVEYTTLNSEDLSWMKKIVEKTWKPEGSTELITMSEAVQALENPNYYKKGTVMQALQEGATLQSPYAYYRLARQLDE
jgi:hypothetical protein